MFWIMMVSFAVLIGVAIMIYLMPSDAASKKKKKDKEKEKERAERAALIPDPLHPDKDWKAIAERWEKNNNGLMGDLEKMKMRERAVIKESEQLKASQKELLDKLSLEKGWREKEQVNFDKVRHHEKDLKDQIIRTEKDLEAEHSQRLNLERDLQELRIKYDTLTEEKRNASTRAASLQVTVDGLIAQLKELRRDNEELKKKREDIQWVAKSEYDDLLRKFKELQGK